MLNVFFGNVREREIVDQELARLNEVKEDLERSFV